MPSVCFYFQVHQPFRLSPRSGELFDEEANCSIMRKVAAKCYLPANALLLKLIERFPTEFHLSFSITGVAIDQMKQYAPAVLESFRALVDTGCVELIGETYHHSLAALYDEEEYREQVGLHRALMESTFGHSPCVFRNTELIYDDRIGRLARELGFHAVIAEGADDILGWRSPHFLYSVPEAAIPLLLKSYRLSDDIAFRFSNRSWAGYPLTAEKFAGWLHQLDGSAEVVNLFMDYETFGEHQWSDCGIFAFLENLPEAVLRKSGWTFSTVSEALERYRPVSDLPFHRLTSWADLERDITAWQGNRMQKRALAEAYALGTRVKATQNPGLIETWRRLLTSDHFYYLCTKWFADGDVHAYFSPFESPYDAFVHYMTGLKKVEAEVEARGIPLEV